MTEEQETTEPQGEQKPAETVEFWKQKAREQEKRAKANASAATQLAELEEAQKSEAQKAADRVSKAEAEVETIPAKVSEALRGHLVEVHQIDKDDADLFLTGTEPDLLLKQVTRLLDRSGKRKKKGNVAPKEGGDADTGSHQPDDMREFTRGLFGRDD